MDKEQWAHDWAMNCLKSGLTAPMEDLVVEAWNYTDAMQAEADKRNQDSRSLTKDQEGNCLHFHHDFGHKKCFDCGASLEEWQPDWSVAPEWAKYFAMDKDEEFYYFEESPSMGGCSWQPQRRGGIEETFNHSYKGNWQDSLRKRPQGI